MAAPASFRAGIEQAAAILSATITNKITVNLAIELQRGPASGAVVGPDTGLFVNYSTVRADLIAQCRAGRPNIQCVANGLNDPGTIGSRGLECATEAVWFGASLQQHQYCDGSATFATDIQPNLLVGGRAP